MMRPSDGSRETDHVDGYDEALAALEVVYVDTIVALRSAEIAVNATQTGGMAMALEIPVRNGRLLLTDAYDELSWNPQVDQGWALGLYDEDEIMVWQKRPFDATLPPDIIDADGALIHERKSPQTAVHLAVVGINLVSQTPNF